jgi:AcrR family transcriptional regulator
MKKTISSSPDESVMDLRMQRSRRAIREGFLALLQRKRFDQITARDIAAESAIGYATFFRHYASKEALLHEVAADEIQKLMELSGPLLKAKGSLASCQALCDYVYEHRAIWTILLTGGAAEILREEFTRLALERRYSPKLKWLPDELGAAFGVSSTIEIISWWLKRPNELTPRQVATVLDRLVVTPTAGGSKK